MSDAPGFTCEQRLLYVESELVAVKAHARAMANALREMYALCGEERHIDHIFHRTEMYCDMY